MEPLFDFIA